MSRRGDFDPDENETKEFEVSADTSAENDESSHIEEIPVIEESSIRDDPLGGETAAAAWAAGATPSPEMIPVGQAEPKEGTPPDASEAPGEGEGLRPYVPEGDPEPTEPAEPGPFIPVAERRSESSAAGVWDEEEVRLPGAEDPLVTPQHVESPPAAYAATQTAEAAEDDTASNDLLITERGHTIITPRVVEKIAGRAASEVDGVGGVQSSGLGRFTDLFSGPEKRETQAHAEVDRASTAVDLVVSVRYPEPVGAVANRVREHVVRRLHELTGLQVGEVNVTIPELVVPSAPPPRPRVI
ncbi:MAG: Asp23/Gls24 family envelope stress response protein [Actinomycetota bacterium]|nr:Asp23/Gls24 family envelope stress response protein [Actinomycetota bacterium]